MVTTATDDALSGLILTHPRIAIATYPWEWTPAQWLAAAELTLRLCDEAVDVGWILKDATPLNILFVGTRPVLVDVVSFERRNPGSSVWLAYGQFVRTFLLPLIAHRQLGWPLAATLLERDGYEPAELYKRLSWPQRLSRTAFWPVTLPAWLERKGSAVSTPAPAKDAGVATHLLKRNLAGLLTRTRRAVAQSQGSEWSDYQTTLTHYTPEQSAQKRRWVETVLTRTSPANLLDVGANTGEYSMLAAGAGNRRDRARARRSRGRPAVPHHAGKAASGTHPAGQLCPPPRPRSAGRTRSQARCCPASKAGSTWSCCSPSSITCYCLKQIPLRAIMKLCARLTSMWMIVEWVPVTDPMFQSLIARPRCSLWLAR